MKIGRNLTSSWMWINEMQMKCGALTSSHLTTNEPNWNILCVNVQFSLQISFLVKRIYMNIPLK